MSKDDFWGEPISIYTSEQATEDGFLFQLNLKANIPFSHVTTNLMYQCGYMEKDTQGEDHINMTNMTDLLNQALEIMRKSKPDWFYSGKIELPSGTTQKIFIVQNETGKYTIMLPEDY